jgi:hypothetical protein
VNQITNKCRRHRWTIKWISAILGELIRFSITDKEDVQGQVLEIFSEGTHSGLGRSQDMLHAQKSVEARLLKIIALLVLF